MAKKLGHRIVIEGLTEDGEVFRPTDWPDRISGNLSTFKNHRMLYSPLLQPSMKGGNRCVVLDEALKESNPALYAEILNFAKINRLRICGDTED